MTPDSAAPNWETVEEDILCPLCDYHLRGLVEPRCPECGFRFVWEDLIDPSRRRHPYLFEHHSERGAWSFWRTLTATLWPRRFWRALHPSQPSSRNRLILYWAISILPMILATGANVGGLAIAVRLENQRARSFEKSYISLPQNAAVLQSAVQQFGSLDNYLDTTYPVEWGEVFNCVRTCGSLTDSLFLPAIFVLAWPWLTMFALLLFPISMNRARVRRIHVLRCLCYSADISFWLGLVIIPPALFFAFRQPARMPWAYLQVGGWELHACAVAMLVFGFRLIVAYRSYLRFPRSVWVILISQVIAFLLLRILTVLVVAWH